MKFKFILLCLYLIIRGAQVESKSCLDVLDGGKCHNIQEAGQKLAKEIRHINGVVQHLIFRCIDEANQILDTSFELLKKEIGLTSKSKNPSVSAAEKKLVAATSKCLSDTNGIITAANTNLTTLMQAGFKIFMKDKQTTNALFGIYSTQTGGESQKGSYRYFAKVDDNVQGGRFEEGLITGRDGDEIVVKFLDGLSNKYHQSAIIKMDCEPQVNDIVIAYKNNNDYAFRGTVLKMDNGRLYIHFVDGTKVWVSYNKVYKMVSLASKECSPVFKWGPIRKDMKCGKELMGDCNAKGNHPCCSDNEWCGNTHYHCQCVGCVDFRKPGNNKPVKSLYSVDYLIDKPTQNSIDGIIDQFEQHLTSALKTIVFHIKDQGKDILDYFAESLKEVIGDASDIDLGMSREKMENDLTAGATNYVASYVAMMKRILRYAFNHLDEINSVTDSLSEKELTFRVMGAMGGEKVQIKLPGISITKTLQRSWENFVFPMSDMEINFLNDIPPTRDVMMQSSLKYSILRDGWNCGQPNEDSKCHEVRERGRLNWAGAYKFYFQDDLHQATEPARQLIQEAIEVARTSTNDDNVVAKLKSFCGKIMVKFNEIKSIVG